VIAGFLVNALMGVPPVALVKLAFFAEVLPRVALPFVPTIIACARGEWACHLASAEGTVVAFSFGP
jgi:hypothetical protein